MQKIVPHIWFDTKAKEAAEFYATAFGGDSRVRYTYMLPGAPGGDVEVVAFTLLGHEFLSISAGPYFKPNPSLSFSVSYATKEEVDALWGKLLPGGKVLMELGSYPYSERYGWLEDKYGVSWQIISLGDAPVTQTITPSLMFVGDVCGKAEEAINFYASVFKGGTVGDIYRYEAGEGPDKAGTVAHSSVTLLGQQFIAMDSARMHEFSFTEGLSLIVNCDTQEEIDYYWNALAADPAGGQCGWLKDKYGFSWQIVPHRMEEMLRNSTPEQRARVVAAYMPMTKLDIATIEKAYAG